MTPEIGKLYEVPSGMGGSFTATVLAIYEAGRTFLDGKPLPARVHLRVVEPLNRDWHDHTFEMNLELFEREARPSARDMAGAVICAIAEVIRAAGWEAMAREFVAEPEKRDRILAVVSRDILRRFGEDKAREFRRLLDAAQARKAHFR